ncbi:MAG: hypothetical protein HOL90_05535 [Candidatus Nitrosopelagicus sp.]|jgi:hypothetical protein|nr:hypothetical protein [Candidatus Nitrosopelagicus sp.]MBT6646399.1 hypothetical protein [Nitrososphaerota archaeon]
MSQVYPALTQTNLEKHLEFEIKEEPYFQEATYTEFDTINLSNYKNYVFQAQQGNKKCSTCKENNLDCKHNWKGVEFNEFVLPGQGEYKSYCKKWISWGCDNTKQHPNNEQYVQHEIKSCKVADCPKCFESWINRQANRTTRRLTTFAEDRQYEFRHIILSPPTEAKDQDYPSLKKWLDFALKKANIKTAAVVFHPFRFQDNKKSMPYLSPHFHLLVYGKVTNTTEFYNKTKWLIKNKGDLGSEIDVFNCVRYLLSHAGVRKRTHVVRYLGDISYRKLKIEKDPISHNCPFCELPLRVFKIKFDQKARPPPIDYVGLWDSKCFEAIDPHDPEAKIPFYEMNEDPKSDIDYKEFNLYSFEELLKISLVLPIISDRFQELSLTDRLTSLNCQKITTFC